jgi:hypothetical protein
MSSTTDTDSGYAPVQAKHHGPSAKHVFLILILIAAIVVPLVYVYVIRPAEASTTASSAGGGGTTTTESSAGGGDTTTESTAGGGDTTTESTAGDGDTTTTGSTTKGPRTRPPFFQRNTMTPETAKLLRIIVYSTLGAGVLILLVGATASKRKRLRQIEHHVKVVLKGGEYIPDQIKRKYAKIVRRAERSLERGLHV